MIFNRKSILLLCAVFFFSYFVIGQEIITDKEAFEKQYQERISKEILFGVYIPIDLDDAFGELERLTDEDMIQKFKSAHEDTIAKKLHFSLGRWMIHNWGFYEGSRLSHFLKQQGVSFPDDMAQLIMVSWHRKLNNEALETENQIALIQEKRKREAEDREKGKKVIKIEKKKGAKG